MIHQDFQAGPPTSHGTLGRTRWRPLLRAGLFGCNTWVGMEADQPVAAGSRLDGLHPALKEAPGADPLRLLSSRSRVAAA